jgi:hypothetical protein
MLRTPGLGAGALQDQWLTSWPDDARFSKRGTARIVEAIAQVGRSQAIATLPTWNQTLTRDKDGGIALRHRVIY